MHARELLIDTLVHTPTLQALEGLSSEDAARKVPGANHSIVEILAHMTFWQDWFIARCEGRAAPMVPAAAAGWPSAGASDWPGLEGRFRGGLERLVQIGEQGTDRAVDPPIEFGPLAHYTVGDALVHVATHNAHHLGQVIVIRQILQRWPPPSGGWTW